MKLESTPIITRNIIAKEKCIGVACLNDEEWHFVRVVLTTGENYLLAGSACNTGLLAEYGRLIENYESVDEALREMAADIEAGDHPSGELLAFHGSLVL
jgi:hypothetical protein